MSAPRDAAGFVLVGGRSSRMGRDKATLPYRGMPLAKHIALQMEPTVDEVLLIGDPDKYSFLGLPVLADQASGEGPVQAIITALRANRATFNIVSACDLPGVPTEFFARLLERIRVKEVQCVVPVTPDGREQVLCSVYRQDAGRELAGTAERRLRTAVRRLNVDYWPVADSGWAVNLNTPEDWAGFQNQEAS